MAKLWNQKIHFIRNSKKFYSKISYMGVALWPIMAPEVYVYYKDPEKVAWRKVAMILKCLFTIDKFNVKGKKGKVLASYIMARKDHYDLVKKALEKFPKKDLAFLDAYEYKKSKSPLKVSYRLPDIFLLYKIWRKFKNSKMKEALKEKYIFFIARTYFRYKQIEQFQKIYDKYSPKAYISFCSQAFPEEAIMTLICKNNNVPTFTLQHGFIIDFPFFSPYIVLKENMISDYHLLWGTKTYDFLKNHIDKSGLLVVGNPKYQKKNIKEKKTFDPKKATVFLSVISHMESNHNLVKIIDRFSINHNELEFTIKIHPFDDIKNYEKDFTSKNIKFVGKSSIPEDLLKESDFVVIHTTSVGMEALNYKIPIFNFKDKRFVNQWKNNDKFKDFKEFENLFKKLKKSPETLSKLKSVYKNELVKEFFHPPRKSVPQEYYDTITKTIKSFNNKN